MDKDNQGDFTFAKPHNTSSQKLEGPISHPSVSELLGNTELRIHGAQSWSCAFLKNHDLSFINDSKNGLVNIPPLSLPLNAHMDIMVIDADKSSVFKSSLYSRPVCPPVVHTRGSVSQEGVFVSEAHSLATGPLQGMVHSIPNKTIAATIDLGEILVGLDGGGDQAFSWLVVLDFRIVAILVSYLCGFEYRFIFNFAINSSKSNLQPKAGSGAHCQMAADPKRAGVVSGSCHMVRYGEDGGGGGSMGHEGDGDSMGDGGSMGDGDGMGDNGDGSDWGDGDNGGASGG
ncbi:hypothetical protein EV424DRAFT_1347143 [Suillus variegatus]|nr:hypothetical protein EV424DRAFT_1347143 [Suillus variegatus]